MNRGELHRLRTGSPAHYSRPSGSAFYFPIARTTRLRLRGSANSARTAVSWPQCIPSSSTSVRSHSVLWRDGRGGRAAGAVPGAAHRAHGGRGCRPRCGICACLRLFAALAAARCCWWPPTGAIVRSHPAWMLGLAMVHHPLLAAGRRAGGAQVAPHGMRAAAGCRLAQRPTRWPRRWPWAWPLSNWARWLAGSGYGVDAGPGFRWAVTYSNPLAALWSGTPLGIPLHPVQALCSAGVSRARHSSVRLAAARAPSGDVAGLWLIGAGVAVYLTELWRDPEGRGSLLHGALDGPQIAAVSMVLAGAMILRERKSRTPAAVARPPQASAGRDHGADQGAENRGPA